MTNKLKKKKERKIITFETAKLIGESVGLLPEISSLRSTSFLVIRRNTSCDKKSKSLKQNSWGTLKQLI